MKVKEKRWKPEKGERFWFITSQFEAIEDEWRNLKSDFRYFHIGNCFKTKEEAQAAAEKVKALLLSLHGEGVRTLLNVPADDCVKPTIQKARGEDE